MRRLLLIVGLVFSATPVQAQGVFRPIQCERTSIPPADLLLTNGSGRASHKLVLDEDIQIQELLSQLIG